MTCSEEPGMRTHRIRAHGPEGERLWVCLHVQ